MTFAAKPNDVIPPFTGIFEWLFKSLFGAALLGGAVVWGHDLPHRKKTDYRPPTEVVVIGQGEWRYRLVPGWASAAGEEVEIGHGHAMVQDRSGLLYLVNAHADHAVVVLDTEGNLIRYWGDFTPSAHGLTIVGEGSEEYLFITDNSPNGAIWKTTLGGEVLLKIECPMESGLYASPNEFRPSKTIVMPNRDLVVLDGYGKDYVLRFDSKGKFLDAFGGDLGEGEARIEHYGPHGGAVDFSSSGRPELILALSDKQRLKRLSLSGEWIDTISLPGSNPRDIVFHRNHLVIPNLGDDWPTDLLAAGYLTVLNRDFKVVANLGGAPPEYEDGKLLQMRHDGHTFLHPHGILFDREGNLYVAQYDSNGTFPLKFERMP